MPQSLRRIGAERPPAICRERPPMSSASSCAEFYMVVNLFSGPWPEKAVPVRADYSVSTRQQAETEM